jgi:hypothetical protein
MGNKPARIEQLNDEFRRQFVGRLGLATLGITTLGLGNLCRGLKNFTAIDDSGSKFDHIGRHDDIDEVSSRTLYEVVYYDKRMGRYWPHALESELAAVAAVSLDDETKRSDGDD